MRHQYLSIKAILPFCTLMLFCLLGFGQKPDSKFSGVQVGVITYSYRSMPGNLEQVLNHIVNSGINATELMGNPVEEYLGRPKDPQKVAAWRTSLSMDGYKKVKKMFNDAGVSIYAFKPDALGPNNTDAEIEYALEAAKTLGAKTVTVELPKDPGQSERLGRLASKHKIYVSYHNHLQGNDEAWKTALAQSPYNSINLDCGHYIAAGGKNTKENLLAFIQANHKRITSMHLKDRKNKENGGANLPWGQGDTPLAEILNLLKSKHYKIPVSVELEYTIPPASDAVQEVKKCVEFSSSILNR
ncbi:MAG: sugar phosphate isomerase/epimerase [Niabella sp.]